MGAGEPLLEASDRGLYCPPGRFWIDPWRPVPRAVLTHGHADHARPGSEAYLAARTGERVLRRRLGRRAPLELVDYGEPVDRDGVRVSLYPAGHVLGSAQVRIEHRGRVAVVSGDFKVEPDPTCAPFEPVRCDLFVTESTFALPVFRWPAPGRVFAQIERWWRANAEAGRACVLGAYSLGKAQRVLAGVDASIGPIFTHGAVEKINRDYRASGVALPKTTHVFDDRRRRDWAGALVVAPPSALGTSWTRRFGDLESGFASGWMRLRGSRRRHGVDRGFVLSDHCDWPGLLGAIEATGAPEVWVTHGYREPLVRYLGERGIAARALDDRFERRTQEAAEGEVDGEAAEAGGRADEGVRDESR